MIPSGIVKPKLCHHLCIGGTLYVDPSVTTATLSVLGRMPWITAVELSSDDGAPATSETAQLRGGAALHARPLSKWICSTSGFQVASRLRRLLQHSLVFDVVIKFDPCSGVTERLGLYAKASLDQQGRPCCHSSCMPYSCAFLET